MRTLIFALLAAMAAAIAPGADTPADNTETASGLITYANYGIAPEEATGQGIRAARVTDPSELPGGPWAVGEAGDYLIENALVRVIVRGEGRVVRDTTGSTGEIVDITFRDDMWDRFGSLSQFARAGGAMGAILYDTVEIRKGDGKTNPPSLVATGHLVGSPQYPAFTVIHPIPNQAAVAVKTYLGNKSDKPVVMRMATKAKWGAMPPFVGDFGIPPMLRALSFQAPWVCGIEDDFALGVVRVAQGENADTMVNRNETFITYGAAPLQPGQTTEMEMALILTHGDMAPISEFYLRSHKLPVSMLSGKVTEDPTGAPVANAEVEITRIREKNEQTTRDGSYPLPAYAILRTDANGVFRTLLKPGKYALQSRTVGRPAMPPMLRLGFELPEGQGLERNLKQVMPNMVTVEAVDAETGEPLPAKVRFMPVPPTKINLGPPWSAHGARDTVYLKPGANRIPLAAGTYRCIVSRGPEYDTWQKTVKVEWEKPLSLRAEIKHVIDTPKWAAVGLATATDASPDSRVSPEDLALAAAGEGLDWVVTGDLNQATDLGEAIRKQGLGRYVKASRGVTLSYRHPRLYGDFFVFPLPEGVTPKDLDKLATAKTTPAQFFKAVRKAWPGAIICVLNPVRPNASYLSFYGANQLEGKPPSGKDFSTDFDAIAVYQGKDADVYEAAMRAWGAIAYQGDPKIVLPATRTPTLFFEEPGYPRIYVRDPDGKTPPERMNDKQLTEAVRKGYYYITNGPILNVEIDGGWPERIQAAGRDSFEYRYSVKAAPWVRVNGVNVLRNNRSRERHQLMGGENILRYPHDEETAKTRVWNLWRNHRKTGEKLYEDIFWQVEVSGYGLHPVVSQKRAKPTAVFAVTPPVLFDANGDGKYKF